MNKAIANYIVSGITLVYSEQKKLEAWQYLKDKGCRLEPWQKVAMDFLIEQKKVK